MSRLKQVINNQKTYQRFRPEAQPTYVLKDISMTLAMMFDKLDKLFPDQMFEEGEEGKEENDG